MPQATISQTNDRTYVANRIQSRLAQCRVILERIAAEYAPDLNA